MDGDLTHSAECWQWHLDCAVAKVERMTERLKEAEALLADARPCTMGLLTLSNNIDDFLEGE